jgi:hypothetical protein
MAIDPSIPLAVRPPQFANPLETWNALTQIQMQRAATAAQIEERRAQAQDIELKNRALALHQQRQDAITQMLQGAQTIDPQTGIHTYDRGKVTNGLIQAGASADEAKGYLGLLDEADKAIQTARATQGDALKSIANLVHRTGNDPAVFLSEADRAVRNGVIAPQILQPYVAAVQRDPKNVAAITGAILGNEKEQADIKKEAAETALANASAGKAATEGQIQANVLAGMRGGQTAQELATQRIEQQKANAESAKAEIAAKTFNATYGGSVDAQGNPLTGDALLARAKQNPQAMMLANYQLAPPSSRIDSDPKYAGLFAQIKALNPDYDATQFDNRKKTRMAFTTGTQGQQINAMNTAVQHLDLLQQAADALKNGTFRPGNALYNTVSNMFGGTAPGSYEQIKHYVDGEIGNVVTKGAVTVNEFGQQAKSGGSPSSPAQMKTYIDNAIQIMASKVKSLKYQAGQALGDQDPLVSGLVMPEVTGILQKRGFSPDITKTGGAGGAESAEHRVWRLTGKQGAEPK